MTATNQAMLDCINEQRDLGSAILAEETENFAEFRKILSDRQVRNVLILATGSSLNSVAAAKLYLEQVAQVTCTVMEPFTFSAYGVAQSDFDLVVAVSQRGTSSSTIDALKKCREITSAPIVALTAHPDSPISRHVDCVIDIACGPEAVPFSTKGVFASVFTLFLLGITIAESQNHRVSPALDRRALDSLSAQIGRCIDLSLAFYDANRTMLDAASRITILGYGPNIGTVAEAETKITETVRVPTQGFEIEAYMHGPIFELRKSYTVFLTDLPGTRSLERSEHLAVFLRKYCDRVFVISLGNSERNDYLSLGVECDELISPLALLVPYQVLASQMAISHGVDLSVPAFSDFRSFLGTKVPA